MRTNNSNWYWYWYWETKTTWRENRCRRIVVANQSIVAVNSAFSICKLRSAVKVTGKSTDNQLPTTTFFIYHFEHWNWVVFTMLHLWFYDFNNVKRFLFYLLCINLYFFLWCTILFTLRKYSIQSKKIHILYFNALLWFSGYECCLYFYLGFL